MRAFDFDGTLYQGDSSVDFWLFCLRRVPAVVIPSIPRLLLVGFAFVLGRASKERLKESFFSFVSRLSNMDEILTAFWESHAGRMNVQVVRRCRSGDVVVSASPDFLLLPPCSALGMRLIATKFDLVTGRIVGSNCRGEEKARRWLKEGYAAPKEFYTDSTMSDAAMMRLARRSFLVSRNEIAEVTVPEDGETAAN